ncbi:MAG: aminotransferase class I/II-fold pyridoxal phosphate-dependent enzyme, partial [Terriglobia bacterium]
IDLCSNDYLGLSGDPRLRLAVIKSIEQGAAVASTGSRLLTGNARVWEELECEFAAFAGAESALFFTSGYAANIGLLSVLLGPDDVVFSDSSNHASLIDGIRLSRARRVVFPHLDLNFLDDHLRRAADAHGQKFIVVESLFSMEGDCAPLRELAALASRYGAEMIVDEAHATGVFGPQGRGLLAEAGLSGRVLASIYTCGKALASMGAFVACPEPLKRLLVNRARTFIFSTALPPYMAFQIRAAIALLGGADEQRTRLFSISKSLRAQLNSAGFNVGRSSSPIVPVVLGSNERALAAAERLRSAGFAIRAVRPPTVPPGTARLRLSLNAKLSALECERLGRILPEACRLESNALRIFQPVNGEA